MMRMVRSGMLALVLVALLTVPAAVAYGGDAACANAAKSSACAAKADGACTKAAECPKAGTCPKATECPKASKCGKCPMNKDAAAKEACTVKADGAGCPKAAKCDKTAKCGHCPMDGKSSALRNTRMRAGRSLS